MAKSKKTSSSTKSTSGSSVKSYAVIIVVIAALIGAGSFVVDKLGNVLSGFTGEAVLSMPQLQVVVSAFCMSPIPSMLLTPKRTYDGPGMSIQREFTDTGDVNEDDYVSFVLSPFRSFVLSFFSGRHPSLRVGPGGRTPTPHVALPCREIVCLLCGKVAFGNI